MTSFSIVGDQQVDAGELRRAMGRFTTGVAVVLTEFEEAPHGATINSLTCISLSPPLILISLGSENRMTAHITNSGQFSANILRERQQKISNRFAKPGENRFSDLTIHRGQHGMPVVPEALSTMECSVYERINAGDHVMFLGLVHSAIHQPGRPLVFHSGRYGEFVGPDDEAHGLDSVLFL